MGESVRGIWAQFLGALPMSAMSRVLSAVESHPTPLHSTSDRRTGGQFGARLKRLQPYSHRLPCGPVYRQAFLWGAANYFKGLPHEELVVGFGVGQGRRTRIGSTMKIRGEARWVAMEPDEAAVIHGFLNEDEHHTAILVHNHPDDPVLWLLGLVFGNSPLPSLEDSDFGGELLFERFRSRLDGFAFGRMRFYLVQNETISEFSGLTSALLLKVLRIAISAVPGRLRNGDVV